jgi:hypothetical protein
MNQVEVRQSRCLVDIGRRVTFQRGSCSSSDLRGLDLSYSELVVVIVVPLQPTESGISLFEMELLTYCCG